MQPQAYKPHSDFMTRIAQHPVAANLLMVMMFIAGLFALSKLNTQFFPNFALDYVSVRVVWPGANPEDVEVSITTPIEEAVRSVENLKSMSSASVQGVSSVTLEYQKGTDLVKAVDQVKQKISEIRNLPADAEQPIVQSIARYENIASVLLSSEQLTREELGRIALRAEKELLAAGVDSIKMLGLPLQRMSIEVPMERLAQQGMNLDALASRLSNMSRDLPSGTAGRSDVARDLRALEQQRTELGFEQLVIDSDAQGQIRLGDLAEVSQKPRQSEPFITSHGHPAIQLTLSRAETGDSLVAAKILQGWLNTSAKELPPSVKVEVFDQSWQLIEQRTTLLVNNGISGLVVVVLILYLFMNGRVAFWVAVGIPVSFAATLAILYFTGGSINMISLFALIMALGIIVDDAIVVGENALSHYQYGESPLLAAEGGAHRMFWPVLASSLTTVAAFLPLMLVGGVIGNILIAIPIVIISVILASLIECFLILPGHLRSSFQHMHRQEDSGFRLKLNQGFETFKDQKFRPMVQKALRNRGVTIALILSSLIVSVGLLAGGRINFTFFPTPEGKTINMQVVFLSGTPQSELEGFMTQATDALYAAEKAVGESVIETSVTRYFLKAAVGGSGDTQGETFGSMVIELKDPDQRDTRNEAFIRAWKDRVILPPGVESFLVVERQAGPPGRDVSVKLIGPDAQVLKTASLDLQQRLSAMAGVTDIEDDLPFGKDQWIFHLTPQALALGLDNAWLSRQLRGYFDGLLVQIYTQQGEEVEVRVSLPEAQQRALSSLYDATIILPDGSFVPLNQLVTWTSRQGFEVLRHFNGRLSVEVGADVLKSVGNANVINQQLRNEILPDLATQYGLSYNFEGKAKDQAQTMADMKMGLWIGLALIYIVLAWVFGSYGMPLVVMTVIPFGLAGAIYGHYLMGIDLTILSMFGLFALSGIVVNGSIILVSFYKELRAQGMEIEEALAEASVQRFRAVLLTTLTTIGGLMPLLFETSLQAQFLIPMAVSIAFGLAFATVIVLFLIPVLICVYESIAKRWVNFRTQQG